MSVIIQKMRTQPIFYFKGLIWILIVVLFLTACQATPSAPTNPVELTSLEPVSETPSAFSPSPSPTSPTHTPTPQALAARVNDQGISLERYQAELGRYQAAVNRELTSEDRQRVIDSLVDELLLAQAALQNGFTLDETTLQARIDKLTQEAGGQDAINQWMQTHGYSEASFREQLALAISAGCMLSVR